MAGAIAPATAPRFPLPGRGPKPPASARPAHGGRSAPAGSGAGLCFSRACRSTGYGPAGAGETRCVSCSRPNGRGDLHRVNGRVHLPYHGTTLPLGQPGAEAPGQRPPRPWRALCSGRVGRWPLSLPDLPVHRAPSRAGGETRVAFPVPARTGEGTLTASMAGAIAPATVLRRDQDRPGAQSPRSAPAPPPASARPWRALCSGRVGRWPLSLPDLPVYRAPCRAGGETRCVP